MIAKDLGVSRTLLAEQLRKRGVEIRRQAPSSEQVREMCRRYALGESTSTIGRRLGFDGVTVQKYLKAAGVRLRDPQGRER